MKYDPAKHHRRSIRQKGHDYAGGGLYFVTLCAHREFVNAMKGRPFEGAMHEIIKERIRITEEKFPDAHWLEWVIMPDHFHALIRMKGGHSRLGDIVGGFKSAVSREWRRGNACIAQKDEAGKKGEKKGEAGLARTRIWHRNYYEMIVRSAEAEKKIAEYIRMNPWKCVQAFGNGLRGIGNPALWNGEKLGVLCSRKAPHIGHIPNADIYFGGWHSPKEKEIFDWLLGEGKRIIACPAWGIGARPASPGLLDALEGNRMLILEMRNRDGDLAAAEQRNQFVIENADGLFVPHTTPGGMLERLLKEKKRDVDYAKCE